VILDKENQVESAEAGFSVLLQGWMRRLRRQGQAESVEAGLLVQGEPESELWSQPATRTQESVKPARRLTHLEVLESEAIHILREVAGECRSPALLFSGGKDSIVLLRLAEKAFRPGRFPFPLLHIDTGHNFPEVIAFRDSRVRELSEQLIVCSVEETIRQGKVVAKNAAQSRNAFQSVTLLDAIEQFGFDALIGGARRDEEKARAKERIFSFRDEFGQWDPRNQRPELWDLYNARVAPGEHLRVFPISNWTELDVWQYIARERLALPSLYFAHQRRVIRRGETLLSVSRLVEPAAGETVETLSVRFRTVGDMTCTCPVESRAATLHEIIAETAIARVSERGATRMDDQAHEASMELRKREGYF
jgi:sulfate adenylyltransferase subunit 2